jgi:hypothetical protein
MSVEFTRPDRAYEEPADNAEFSAREPAYAATVVPDELVDLNVAGDVAAPHLTVVIPTRNERKNVGPLLARLAPAVAPLGAELVFVDDSDDDTTDVLADRRASRTAG